MKNQSHWNRSEKFSTKIARRTAGWEWAKKDFSPLEINNELRVCLSLWNFFLLSGVNGSEPALVALIINCLEHQKYPTSLKKKFRQRVHVPRSYSSSCWRNEQSDDGECLHVEFSAYALKHCRPQGRGFQFFYWHFSAQSLFQIHGNRSNSHIKANNFPAGNFFPPPSSPPLR